MNHLDMYTREKANKNHLDEIHREAKNRLMLRNAQEESDPQDLAANRRGSLALVVTALIAAIGSFLRRI
jgi:hypothetical protein